MEIEFDPGKDRMNVAKHGVSLAQVVEFDWDTAQIEQELRFIYAEKRFEATGWLGERLHVVIYCKRGIKRRIISLRKANEREIKTHANSN